MTKTRRFLLAGLSALTLGASLFLYTGCNKKPKPEKFTATLTEIQGVQAIYTVRHPKLIAEDLDLLMTEVPEAAMARMFLGGLTAYGYPEFSDIAAGSNIGIALLEVTAADLDAGKPTLVGFVKLKDGGQISALLAQAGIATQRHGEWVWVAQDAAAFAKIKSADAIIAHLSKPQTEEIVVWGRTSPLLLARAKQAFLPKLEEKFIDRPNADRRALVAYVDVIWSYVAQLHSAGGSLDINAKGITLKSYAQFFPDSDLGTFLRFTPKPAPQIAESIPNDGLLSAVVHQNVPAQIDFSTTLLDKLIAVDYPRGAKLLKDAKASYLALSGHNEGGIVMTLSLDPTNGNPAGAARDIFGVISGSFTAAEVTASYKANAAMTSEMMNSIFLLTSTLTPSTAVPQFKSEFKENAFSIGDIKFDATTTTTNLNEAVTTVTQFYGVVNGNIVYGSSEAALRAKVPAILAKQKVANAVKLSPKPEEFAVFEFNNTAIVDLALKAADIRTTDPKILEEIKALRAGFASIEPVQAVIGASQAKLSSSVTIPYKLISQSIHLYQFTATHAIDSEERIRAVP